MGNKDNLPAIGTLLFVVRTVVHSQDKVPIGEKMPGTTEGFCKQTNGMFRLVNDEGSSEGRERWVYWTAAKDNFVLVNEPPAPKPVEGIVTRSLLARALRAMADVIERG